MANPSEAKNILHDDFYFIEMKNCMESLRTFVGQSLTKKDLMNQSLNYENDGNRVNYLQISNADKSHNNGMGVERSLQLSNASKSHNTLSVERSKRSIQSSFTQGQHDDNDFIVRAPAIVTPDYSNRDDLHGSNSYRLYHSRKNSSEKNSTVAYSVAKRYSLVDD